MKIEHISKESTNIFYETKVLSGLVVEMGEFVEKKRFLKITKSLEKQKNEISKGV